MSKRSSFIVHTSRTPCHAAIQKIGEALGSYGWVRRKVASVPPLWRRSNIAPSLLFDSPATSQLGRRSLSFAPPPHDRFALLASAHGYGCLLAHLQCLLSMHHTLNPRATQYLAEKFGHTEAVLCVDVSHRSFRTEGSPKRYEAER
jgi:hypothetical protein